MSDSYELISIPSQNYAYDSDITPQFIIVHCIGLPLDDVIQGLTQPLPEGLGVSAHYFIPQTPISVSGNLLSHPHPVPVLQFVPETKKAYHAGLSHWKSVSDLNQHSIGIEFHAPGYGCPPSWCEGEAYDLFHFTPYTPQQIDTGRKLIHDLCHRWNIPPHHVLAHSDIAPYRPGTTPDTGTMKTDPGPLFPWHQIFDQEGKYKEMDSLNSPVELFVRQRLHALGYTIKLEGEWGMEEKCVLTAYQFRFMQEYYLQRPLRPSDKEFGMITQAVIESLGNFDI